MVSEPPHLFIRADANVQIGTGHIMRCLALAQAWQDRGGKVTFISRCESKKIQERISDEGFDLLSLEKPYPHPSDLVQTLRALSTIQQQPTIKNWLVADGYHFDSMYQKKIKEAGHKLLWIDDYGHTDHYYADIVLNQNVSAEECFYKKRETSTRLLLGTHYVLLRREFIQWQGWEREDPSIARKVLITMGGSDPDNVTLKVIQALKKVFVSGLEAKSSSAPQIPICIF